MATVVVVEMTICSGRNRGKSGRKIGNVVVCAGKVGRTDQRWLSFRLRADEDRADPTASTAEKIVKNVCIGSSMSI
jgi:hypothetical protein